MPDRERNKVSLSVLGAAAILLCAAIALVVLMAGPNPSGKSPDTLASREEAGLPGKAKTAASAEPATAKAESKPAASEPGPAPAASNVVSPVTMEDPAATGALPAECTKDQLQTLKSGVLTVGTDKPGYPPYIVDDDPSNGKGFESAVAYAVAKALGYGQADVKWTVVPFNKSYAPGKKAFDFDINQISITPDRQKVVDFSDPYYEAPQAIVVRGDSKFASAASIADLKDAQLGVQVGTSSLDAVKSVIAPSKDVKVFDDTAAATAALKGKQIDGIVADLPTAIYLRDAELTGAKVVGQFAAPGGDQWGLLFQKGSPLVACTNAALTSLKASGELDAITQQWMSKSAEAPVLQ